MFGGVDETIFFVARRWLAVGVLLSPVVTSQCRPAINSLTGHAIELCEGQTKPLLLSVFNW